MKNIILFLLLLTSFTGFSQANVTSSGISLKGILRDGSNTILTNQAASIKAELYYIGANNTEVTFITRTGNITSDGFGVFSFIVDINKSEFIKISNYPSYIKVNTGSTLLVKEKLKTVPYAIHAQNGVPTGAIIAISTARVPPGYILADGRAIPNDDYHAALRAMFGSNVPDLRGLFLRGAGTQTVSGTSYTGPSVRAYQADGVETHLHAFTFTGTTSNAGAHQHAIPYNKDGGVRISPAISDTNIEASSGGVANSDDSWLPDWFDDSGGHTHTFTASGTSGAFPSSGGTQTTPVANGVLYIIKI